MENIFGLDLGTNSIGFSIRNPNIENDIIQQFVKYGALVFKKGVGSEKGNEFSYAEYSGQTVQRFRSKVYS